MYICGYIGRIYTLLHSSISHIPTLICRAIWNIKIFGSWHSVAVRYGSKWYVDIIIRAWCVYYVYCTLYMCTIKTSACHTAVWTDTYGHPCSLTFTNMIIIMCAVCMFFFYLFSPFHFLLLIIIAMNVWHENIAYAWVSEPCRWLDGRHGRSNGKNRTFFVLTTYVPSNSLRWYFSSIENCLSGSRRSRFDFFVESFFPNSGILEFFKLLFKDKFSY